MSSCGGSPAQGGQITAFATRNPDKRSGDWTGIQGNFGPPGTMMDFDGVTAVADYQDLGPDPDIDLVESAAARPARQVTLEAWGPGKHVLVEKPIAVTGAARRMVAAAEEADRLLMVAQVCRFSPSSPTYGSWPNRESRQAAGGHFRR
ncbi:MAG: hypothetical protein Ct9H300mP1_19680 [Planctomycetaceae bacterium]|nr:MAG: hypothetical protein Ct9H300mP1_19680 [Planctomycetaceae bacterium]